MSQQFPVGIIDVHGGGVEVELLKEFFLFFPKENYNGCDYNSNLIQIRRDLFLNQDIFMAIASSRETKVLLSCDYK